VEERKSFILDSEKRAVDERLSEKKMSEEMERDVLRVVNKKFSLDSLDRWDTSTALVQSVVSYITHNVKGAAVHVFCHESEYHEYREIDREGITSISDDSLFIGCLSMTGGVVSLSQFFSDYSLDDPLIEQCLQSIYGGKYIVPVVHSFELLAFILICSENPDEDLTLTDSQKEELLSVSDRLQINLYAASVAEKQQRELLRLSSFIQALQSRKTLSEIYQNLLKDLSEQLLFDRGVCYAFEEETMLLVPFDQRGIEEKVPSIHIGRGISGQVAEWNKIVSVPDRAKHPSYAAMGDEDFFKGSFISVPFGSPKELYGVVTFSRSAASPFGIEHRYMLEIASNFIASEITNRKLYEKLDESHFNIVKSLTRALEAKDAYTEGHSARVTKYSLGIARLLNYSEERLYNLRYGAMLHDIGKIGITDAIINKTSRLSDEEFSTIKGHTEIGYHILSNNPFFDTIRDFVLYHHETLIGTGYYKKKKGEYPEEAMIISAADIFDALTSDRPYRKALEVSAALSDMKRLSGIHFTQEIYDALCSYALSSDFSTEIQTKAE